MYRILIVEDQEIIRRMLCETVDWKTLGCHVCGQATSGDEGLRCIAEHSPDIVLTDIHLPGIDGIQMLEKARLNEDPSHGCRHCFEPIIITGFSQFEYAKRAIGLDVVDYILKPIDEEKLLAAVRKAVGRIEEKRELASYKHGFVYSLDKIDASIGDEYIKKVLDTIRSDYCKHLNFNSIANDIGISTGYLSRKLKAVTGMSFLDILQRHRIEVAQQLMKENSSLKYYEVAEKVGFSSYKRFSFVFRQVCGYTPSDLAKYNSSGLQSTGSNAVGTDDSKHSPCAGNDGLGD